MKKFLQIGILLTALLAVGSLVRAAEIPSISETEIILLRQGGSTPSWSDVVFAYGRYNIDFGTEEGKIQLGICVRKGETPVFEDTVDAEHFTVPASLEKGAYVLECRFLQVSGNNLVPCTDAEGKPLDPVLIDLYLGVQIVWGKMDDETRFAPEASYTDEDVIEMRVSVKGASLDGKRPTPYGYDEDIQGNACIAWMLTDGEGNEADADTIRENEGTENYALLQIDPVMLESGNYTLTMKLLAKNISVDENYNRREVISQWLGEFGNEGDPVTLSTTFALEVASFNPYANVEFTFADYPTVDVTDPEFEHNKTRVDTFAVEPSFRLSLTVDGNEVTDWSAYTYFVTITDRSVPSWDAVTYANYEPAVAEWKPAANLGFEWEKDHYYCIIIGLYDSAEGEEREPVYSEATGNMLQIGCFFAIGDKASGQPSDTVRVPEITPAAGTYADSVKVEISCATEGAVILYSTDGSAPQAVYPEGGFWLKQSCTVKAAATKDGMENSAVAEAVYTITRTEPSWTEVSVLNGVKMYPNPSGGRFELYLPVEAAVEIYSAAGVEVARGRCEGHCAFSLSQSGVYFVRIAARETVLVKRLIVR